MFQLKQPLAIVGGSGLYDLDGLSEKEAIAVKTPYGPISAPLIKGLWCDKKILFLARHGKAHHLAPHQINYRANVWALKHLGAQSLLLVNCAGGISDDLTAAGRICAPNQFLDLTWGRDSSFFAEGCVKHIDMTDPCDPDFRESLIKAALGFDFYTGECCYATTQGPRLETRAEINYLEKIGADLVGMTAMPEVALAREKELPLAVLSLIVNAAAGRAPGVLTTEAIQDALSSGMQQVQVFLERWLTRL